MTQHYIAPQNNFNPLYCRLLRNGVLENRIIRAFCSASLNWFLSSEFSMKGEDINPALRSEVTNTVF